MVFSVKYFKCPGINRSTAFRFFDSEEGPQLAKHAVIFYGKNETEHQVRCSVSTEVLQDYFGASNKDFLKTFKTHQKEFEQLARAKYLYSKNSASEEVSIVASDF